MSARIKDWKDLKLTMMENWSSRLPMRRHAEKFRRRFGLRRLCYGFMLLVTVAIFTLWSSQAFEVAPMYRPMLSLPASMIPYLQLDSQTGEDAFPGDMYIEDVIKLGSEVMFLVRIPTGFPVPQKEILECRFGGTTHFAYRNVSILNFNNNINRASIVCNAPPEELVWDVHLASIEVDRDREIVRGRVHPRYKTPLQWNSTKIVYEVFPTEMDVVVFAHGINHTKGIELPEPARLKPFRCVYGGGIYETAITTHAQEIFRCAHPPKYMRPLLAGKKMTLRHEGILLESLGYYTNNPRILEESYSDLGDSKRKKYQICSCTMIYNGAKFLKEWVYYHSHLGVEKFFLYDNNSEDGLDEILQTLEKFNVTQEPWPWVKTQEAGFSHCALRSLRECKWMLYTDIDEFLFPNEKLLPQTISSKDDTPQNLVPAADNASAPAMASLTSSEQLDGYKNHSGMSIIASVIQKAVTLPAEPPEVDTQVVGQINFLCRSFGPTNLTASPPQGVTQGYTCRMRKVERHKALVMLDAIAESMQNIVHHFTLRPEFRTNMVRPTIAVVNHYKYQAWDEFKAKFYRRAATYVADWTEDRNHASKDRVPHLGMKPIKPADWEGRYCEVHDYGLRDYTRQVFGTLHNHTLQLAWEM